MFITQSRHGRNSLGVSLGWSNVDDEGLGIVVTQTTRFDPTRMKNRFIYWLESAAEEMARQVRIQIKEIGYDVDEASKERQKYRSLAISQIPFNEMSTKVVSIVANWSIAGISIPKPPNVIAAYIKMGIQGLVSYALPWVGLTYTLFTLFKKKKKPKMAIMWDDIYSKATTFAQESTVAEESNRLVEEIRKTRQLRVATMEKRSQEAAIFKLPEGVIGISRGALVMAPKGKPVEVRKVG